MVVSPSQSKASGHWVSFTLITGLVSVLYAVYIFNMATWTRSPDYGWRAMYDSGPNVVAEVFEKGDAAGLKVGDRIVAVNGKSYDTFDELLFEIRNEGIEEANRYTLVRDDKLIDATIINEPMGYREVLKRSGVILVMGMIFVLIGILVCLMKPGTSESRIFLVMMVTLGTQISYASPSDLMRPYWMYDIRMFLEVLLPAPIIHLALVFPKRRTFLTERKWSWLTPYLIALAIFGLYQVTAPQYWSTPAWLSLINDLFLLISILSFFLLILWNIVSRTSTVIKLQSQVIGIGLFVGLFIPVLDLILRKVADVYLFPDPTMGFTLALSAFPISIGYALVKHDLFTIDVIIRRTYGYILSTAAIIGLYGTIVSLLNLTFQSTELSRSPSFSLGFALLVVFTFRPLHSRVQGFVDRVFYREKYDYRKTIREISESLLRILDPEQIRETLLGSVVQEMHLDNGLLIMKAEDGGFSVHGPKNGLNGDLTPVALTEDDLLIQVLSAGGSVLPRHEVQLNPVYSENRVDLDSCFSILESEIMIPMRYQDEFRGILSLGRKKSGKMFTLEDVDLLRTIANQGSVALENAKLFEENLEKGRMEEELKIAHDLQVSMLPENSPHMENLQVAARSISAREIGGDFYDFIEMESVDGNRQLGIIVADVSGKAVSGALVMSASRSVFRFLADENLNVQDTMRVANARLKKDIRKGMFVALLYGVVDPAKKTLALCSAGQTQPILIPNEGTPILIETEGDRFPLGIVETCDYQETTIKLGQGDTLIFYTDGIVEAMNEQEVMYGFDRFQRVLQEGRRLTADRLLEHIIADVSDFVGDVEQHDDITVVVIRVH